MVMNFLTGKPPAFLIQLPLRKKMIFRQKNDMTATKKSVPSPPSPTMFFGEMIFFMTSPASKPDSSANLRSNFLVDP